jgi:hypothetical protein
MRMSSVDRARGRVGVPIGGILFHHRCRHDHDRQCDCWCLAIAPPAATTGSNDDRGSSSAPPDLVRASGARGCSSFSKIQESNVAMAWENESFQWRGCVLRCWDITAVHDPGDGMEMQCRFKPAERRRIRDPTSSIRKNLSIHP